MEEKLPTCFEPVYRYQMKDGEPIKRKELKSALWREKGVVYARVYRNQVVYVGKTDGTLGGRILRHVNGISKATAGKAKEYREWAEGKTITILAHKPKPVRRSGLEIHTHRDLEAELIRRLKPPSEDCKQPWFVDRT